MEYVSKSSYSSNRFLFSLFENESESELTQNLTKLIILDILFHLTLGLLNLTKYHIH